MRILRLLLWVQLVLGLLVGFLALAAVHGGELSRAWVYGLRVENDKMKQAPDYHPPPAIKNQSFDQILSGFEASGQAHTAIAFCWLLTCGCFVFLAIVMLALIDRFAPDKQPPQPTAVGAAHAGHRRWFGLFQWAN